MRLLHGLSTITGNTYDARLFDARLASLRHFASASSIGSQRKVEGGRQRGAPISGIFDRRISSVPGLRRPVVDSVCRGQRAVGGERKGSGWVGREVHGGVVGIEGSPPELRCCLALQLDSAESLFEACSAPSWCAHLLLLLYISR